MVKIWLFHITFCIKLSNTKATNDDEFSIFSSKQFKLTWKKYSLYKKVCTRQLSSGAMFSVKNMVYFRYCILEGASFEGVTLIKIMFPIQ